MYVAVTMSEGEWWCLVEASALSLVEAYKTGELHTEYAGVIKPAAIRQSPESNIVYDFIIKNKGLNPIRFIRNHNIDKYRWAN